MVLTDEQRKRMEDSRRRAQEIRRKKQLEKEKNEKTTMASGNAPSVFDAGGFVGKSSEEESQNKKRRIEDGSKEVREGKKNCKKEEVDGNTKHNVNGSSNTNEDAIDDDESSLEDFELDAPSRISQTEAQRAYCIPMGTLAVCAYIEKDNPRQRGFSKMKLYERSEVRRRARKRFGGKVG
eukprot:CAMPEP_0201957278 /NCGR_PEP_ID=MMETSP0904-20121228/4677_1 /ASSEMBLY_ACC=CAM_ASM_000553 /TAXON_ID=420261 /ORGANISM="Thalassiosira antarctica, Strain CCMP982" /LENGTH=179 /DNA_ID=CAMNT_0048502245 /DNA_START=388 /DNA_END=923 /DNA_ORIENTATION=+